LQAYDIPGRDFTQGVLKSAFGEKRTISIERLGVVVRIDVSKAVVSPISAENDQFDALELQITVDNLSP
jgi:hypothetical protein